MDGRSSGDPCGHGVNRRVLQTDLQPPRRPLHHRFTVLLVNARHLKQVPGRKSDTGDCPWIAQLLQQGLLKGSCIPARPQRQWRGLSRQRTPVEAAWGASPSKNSYPASQYRRLVGRRAKKRDLVAVGHSLLVIFNHLLKQGTPYTDLEGNTMDRQGAVAQAREVSGHAIELADGIGIGRPAVHLVKSAETDRHGLLLIEEHEAVHNPRMRDARAERGYSVGHASFQVPPEQRMEAAQSATLLRRLATPQDIAAAALFLASAQSAAITGQTLYVDGGQFFT